MRLPTLLRRATFALTYSHAGWSNFKASVSQVELGSQNIACTAEITVKNVSDVAGRDVVQLYISDPVCSFRRPKQELKGIAKTRELQPGESATLTFQLDRAAFSFFDNLKNVWHAEKGSFILHAARSSADTVLSTEVHLNRSIKWTGV